MNRGKIKFTCEKDVFEFLDSSREWLKTMFPDTWVSVNDPKGVSRKVAMDTLINFKILRCKKWLTDVLERAIEISISGQYDEIPPTAIDVPPRVARIIIHACLDILACERDLTDDGLLYASDVASVLNIDAHAVDTLIEQVQYVKRKRFTQMLLECLNDQQRYWVAAMLWQAIHIDDKVHTQEYKYFENISHLLNYDQVKFHQLEQDHDLPHHLPIQHFDETMRSSIYKYIVEIVMIDGEYDPKEAEFIQFIGETFNFDKSQQDQIIQPVASALMLRRSLFSY
ncbi:MAG: hypothetical protein HQM12_08500 [SAR324 cluster bacterium]|nr:hypothetical protein [SAR324 cluster bacterium]